MSKQKPLKEDKDNSGLRTAARLSGIGLQMGLTIYLGNLLGSWLDQKFEQNFWEIGLTLFAIAVSLYSVIKQANALNK